MDLAGVEDALQRGFAGVQMARALIREPQLVRQWERYAAKHPDPASLLGHTSDSASSADEEVEKDVALTRSQCSHCNVCVLAALTPEVPSRCVERPPSFADVEDAAKGVR